MSNTFVQPGSVMTYANAGAVTSGVPVLINGFLGIPRTDAGAGVSADYDLEGVHLLNKLSTDVCAVGDLLYWDNTNFRLTKTASGNTLVGRCFLAAGNGATQVQIRLFQ